MQIFRKRLSSVPLTCIEANNLIHDWYLQVSCLRERVTGALFRKQPNVFPVAG